MRRLIRYARRHRGRTWAATGYSIANKVFDLAPPVLIGAAIDIVVEGESSIVSWTGVTSPKTLLAVLAGISVAVWILESVAEYLQAVAWRNLAQTVEHELRIDAYSRVQHLDLAYFEERSTGDLMAVLNDDVNQLERFLDRGANDLLQVGTTVVLISTAFFLMAPGVALLAMIPIPIVVVGSFFFQSRIAARYADVREQAGALNGQLNNNLQGVVTIKSFTSEDVEVARIAATSAGYLERNRAAIKISSAFSPLIRMAIVLGFMATLVYGGLLAIDGALSVGSYGVMVFLSQRLLWPLTRLGETFDLFHRAMASTTRVLDVLDSRPTIVSGTTPVSIPAVRGRIEFDRLDFRYHPDAPVLNGLSLTFAAGETTAIVGSTGAGKSTIIKLMLRLYDPTGGSITLDGADLRDLDLQGLRRAIGLVSQDVFLFHGTVAENIAYGNPAAGHDAIVAAARAAEAHEFIADLPDGYDTVVGERGQKLSGGQRQRVSIARAILKDPPVLVLDEATSSVDNETEAAIQRSLALVSEGRTTVVIAHRLSTIRDADRIYVIEGGRLVEQGRHDELVAAGGAYAALWSVQTGAAARRRD
ncbi:MAG: ABC transporter ATP-binding protein/permease [Acidimicrobiia bacterium]|nr:ABC transporter ATP-binding protein/permease [Acidimicrobiia bacterium]